MIWCVVLAGKIIVYFTGSLKTNLLPKSFGAFNTGFTIFVRIAKSPNPSSAKRFFWPRGYPIIQNRQNLVFRDVFLEQTRNACAFAVAANVQVVASHRFAHQTDFRQHRPSATVGAACNAQNNVFVLHLVLPSFHQFYQQIAVKPFRFRHRQGASGQGNTSHWIFTLSGHAVAD